MAAKGKHKVLRSHTPVVRKNFQSKNNIALLNITSKYKWASLVAQTVKTACNEGDLALIPGLGRSPERGHDNPLQYSCLENAHGQRSLVGYSPWGRKESDTTEQLSSAANSKYFRLWATYSLCCIFFFFLNNALKM